MQDDPIAASNEMRQPQSADNAELGEPTAEAIPSPLSTPQPVAPSERIAAVDVLRGVALLGILTMNIVAFAWPFAGYENPIFSGGDNLANRTAWLVNAELFAGKMMSLFSMLFGAGLVLMAGRAKEKGASIGFVYYRRMFWLLVFGLIHAYLIWFGDILFFYACCGMLVYLVYRLPPRWLLGMGIGMVGIGILAGCGFVLFAGFAEQVAAQVGADRAAGRKPADWQTKLHKTWTEDLRLFFRPTQEEAAEEIAVFRGSYWEIVRFRAPNMLVFQIAGIVFLVWGIAGRMLLGMGLMKLGVFSAQRSWRFYRLLALCGYGFGLPLTTIGAVSLLFHDYDVLRTPWGDLLFSLGIVPVALGHAAVVMMICKAKVWQRLTYPLAAVGRMALTNYLMQSLICTTLFYGYGFGMFGYIDRVGLWGVVVAVWAVQLIYSPIWLAYFRYGPAEWLWRTLTYWKWQPMRNRAV